MIIFTKLLNMADFPIDWKDLEVQNGSIKTFRGKTMFEKIKAYFRWDEPETVENVHEDRQTVLTGMYEPKAEVTVPSTWTPPVVEPALVSPVLLEMLQEFEPVPIASVPTPLGSRKNSPKPLPVKKKAVTKKPVKKTTKRKPKK